MKKARRVMVWAIAVTSLSAAIEAEVVTEASLGSGYQGNVFGDSSATGDVQTTAGAALRFYPASVAELSTSLAYSAYNGHPDLSNMSGGFSATIMPSSPSSSFLPVVTGSVAMRLYGAGYEAYDQWSGSSGVGLTCRPAWWMHASVMAVYTGTEYVNSESGSNRGFGLSSALDLSLGGANAVSVGVDIARRGYDRLGHSDGEVSGPDGVDEPEIDVVTFTGVQVRYSRPLGDRTGLSLTAGRRYLDAGDGYAVPAFSLDLLSPWTDLWQGATAGAALKHFFPAQITAQVHLDYYRKDYVDALELDETGGSYERIVRDDDTYTVGLTLSKVFTPGPGSHLTPSLTIGYRDNRSSVTLYDYGDFRASFSISAGF